MIERAKKKDEEAFLALIQRYMYIIRAVIAKYIRNILECDEDDIVKMVILYIWNKIAEFRGGEEAFKYWVGRKTNWICLDLVRAQKEKGHQLPLDTLSDHDAEYPTSPDPGPLDTVLAEEKLRAFQGALSSLPDTYKSVLSLRYQGLSYAQIADVLDIDIKTVGSRLNRGIKMMRAFLREENILN